MFRPYSIAEPRRHKRVNRGAQRTTMPAAWLVVVKIGFADVSRNAIPDEMYEHQHISLLDNLGLLNTLAAEQHIHRCGARRETSQVNVLQIEIAAKLLE